jgi:dethiobiotin synthetase/adenosylmethionine--8-amino-7-oxononanoate aminotransferase
MRNLKKYQIYGANTDVGKTIISTILCKAFTKHQPTEKAWYLKPVSTGPDNEADDGHIARFAPKTKTKCLFQFAEAVSPHIAARSKPVRQISYHFLPPSLHPFLLRTRTLQQVY